MAQAREGTGSTLTRRELLRAAAVAAGGIALAPSSDLLLGTRAHAAGSLDRFIKDRLDDIHCPGLGVAAVHGGQVIWSKGYGWSNVAAGRRVDADTPFMLASVSKTVVAVAVLQAWEQNLFGLNDDVNTVLGFSVRNPNHPTSKITVKGLLTHTSGIRDNWGTLTDYYVDGDSPIPLGAFMQRYLVAGGKDYDADRNFYGYAPGANYNYSNMGASLAAYVLEAASGMGFDGWCREQIFEPLGMSRTSWHLSGLPRKRIAMPYRRIGGGGWKPYGHYGYPDYPDGALRTTPRSLAKFLAAVSNGGSYSGGQLLLPATVNMMLTDQVGGPWQGLIFYRTNAGGLGYLLGHNGGDQGVSTDMWFRASDGAGAVVLANGDAYGGFDDLKAIRDRIIQAAPTLA